MLLFQQVRILNFLVSSTKLANTEVILGCYFNDENGKEITIKNGETFLVDQVQHNCGETQRGNKLDNNKMCFHC